MRLPAFVPVLLTASAFGVSQSALSQPQGQVPDLTPEVTNARGATFDAPFNDPGNANAKQLAAQENISVGEATRRLRMKHKAAQLLNRLESQNPGSFSAMQMTEGPSGPQFVVYFVGGPTETNRQRLSSARPDTEIVNNVDIAESAMSIVEVKQLGAKLLQQIRSAGLDTDFGISPLDGGITFLAQNPAEMEKAITSGTISPQRPYKVQKSTGIIPTASLIAGAAWNAYYGDYAECTIGFPVIYNSTTKGTSTAGHCTIDDQVEYNATFATKYGDSGGISLSFKRQWTSDNLDIQWHTASSSHTISTYYWDGTTSVLITGVQRVALGETLCKFGRTTGKTCGNVDPNWWWDKTYSGYFFRLNKPSGSSSLSLKGDSGGPVFSNGIAKGWTHGTDAGGNAYFMAASEIYDKNTGLQVLCWC